MQQGYFITGTDTNVGKTWSTVSLMRYFKMRGKIVAGMKPIAAGCELRDGMLKSADALLLQQNASRMYEYQRINPYAFELPVSPHIAAEKAATPIDFAVIHDNYCYLRERSDIVLIEGAGGWFAPLYEQYTIADLSAKLNLPVILVVAIRLGCLNHALLTMHTILSSGRECSGWIASCTDSEMLCRRENIETLAAILPAPLLGILPYRENADFDYFAQQIQLNYSMKI